MRRLLWILVAGLAGVPPTSADELEKALALPLSPGSVALLVGRADVPAVLERWSIALRNESPEVRAAAARVIFVSGATSLREELKQALAFENDREAALEELRALAASGTSEVDEALLDAARRLDAPGMVAMALAQTRGTRAIALIPALRALGWEDDGGFWLWVTRGGTDGLDLAASGAIREADAGRWGKILSIARRPEASLSPSMILAALTSTEPAVQAATWWHLALVRAHGGELDPRIMAAVATALDAERPADLGNAFALELLGRTLGREPVEQSGWIDEVKAKGRAPYSADLEMEGVALLAELQRSEIACLSAQTRASAKAFGKKRESARQAPLVEERVLGTVDGFPRGYVASLLEASGCESSQAKGVAAAQITYRSDGRPQAMDLAGPGRSGPLGAPPACERAGRVLLATALHDHPWQRPAKKTRLVLLQPETLGCLAEPFAQRRDGPRRAGQRIKEPKKTRHVAPLYPEKARREGIQGTVVLEAITSSSGCIRSLDVLEGVPALNWEAMKAVSQWRYSPTLLYGIPVPTLMTLTVNFRLD